MHWSQVSDTRCDQVTEEKGYVVGVINNVMMGVVQVSGWRRHEKREGENQRRVEFMGELLSDHPSLEYSLKERTASKRMPSFNLPDDDEKES